MFQYIYAKKNSVYRVQMQYFSCTTSCPWMLHRRYQFFRRRPTNRGWQIGRSAGSWQSCRLVVSSIFHMCHSGNSMMQISFKPVPCVLSKEALAKCRFPKFLRILPHKAKCRCHGWQLVLLSKAQHWISLDQCWIYKVA